KTSITALLLLSVISCTKSINSPDSSLQSSGNSEAAAAFKIGQAYHGGIIFYIDNTGQHGLIAATSDQGTQIAWNNGKNMVTGATATAIGSGAANTQSIINTQGGNGSYAAVLCANYSS